jgi:hypothetical protein
MSTIQKAELIAVVSSIVFMMTGLYSAKTPARATGDGLAYSCNTDFANRGNAGGCGLGNQSRSTDYAATKAWESFTMADVNAQIKARQDEFAACEMKHEVASFIDKKAYEAAGYNSFYRCRPGL